MKRIYHHYKKWEDYKAGLYNRSCDNEVKAIKKSISLLSNPKEFSRISEKVLKEWPYACEVNLSNHSRNKQAFIGQAACCYLFGSPEYITKIAWNKLSEKTQERANAVADKIIDKWNKRYGYG